MSNDNISSVFVASGTILKLYDACPQDVGLDSSGRCVDAGCENGSFSGDHYTFSAGAYNLAEYGFDNVVSTIRVLRHLGKNIFRFSV